MTAKAELSYVNLLGFAQNNTAKLTVAGLTKPQASVSTDSKLENDLAFLLCQLEYLRTQLSKRKNRKRSAATLSIMTDMVNVVAEYSDDWLEQKRKVSNLNEALNILSQGNPVVQMLLAKDKFRLETSYVTSMYNRWTRHVASDHQARQQFARAIIDILQTHFMLLVSCFIRSSFIEQWRETYEEFLFELANTARQVEIS